MKTAYLTCACAFSGAALMAAQPVHAQTRKVEIISAPDATTIRGFDLGKERPRESIVALSQSLDKKNKRDISLELRFRPATEEERNNRPLQTDFDDGNGKAWVKWMGIKARWRFGPK